MSIKSFFFNLVMSGGKGITLNLTLDMVMGIWTYWKKS